MVEQASFQELDQSIEQVLKAETNNFFELAGILGLDPKQDFAGADLSGTDFFEGDLTGANFAEANLRGANFAYVNLEGARLTNANLGILPSSYLTRARKLVNEIENDQTNDLDRDLAHDLFSARNLANSIAQDLAQTSSFGFKRAREPNLTQDSKQDLMSVLNRANDCVFSLADTLSNASTSIFDRKLALASDFASNLAANLSCGSELAHEIVKDQRILDIIAGVGLIMHRIDVSRDFASALERTRALSSARAHTHNLICSISGGANFYRANLTGATFDGANVEGAVMIGCTGLSNFEVMELKRRGAIF